MKKAFTLRAAFFCLALLTFVAGAFAQQNFSAWSRQVFHELKPYMAESAAKTSIPEALNKKLLVRYNAKGEPFVRGLLEISGESADADLARLGIVVGTKAGSIRTVSVPVNKLDDLAALNGVKFVELDQPVPHALNEVRTATGAADVHDGIDLPQAYRGAGVLVGVIDGSFDYGHPLLRDDEGETRIRRVWIQGGSGSAPAGYDYGKELTTPEAILAEGSDGQPSSHGAHTSGIAAGNGFMTEGRYDGIAPESDVVLVTFDTSASNVVDAVSYIFDYAESADMPAVINMSFGLHSGPRDGTGLVDRALEELAGPGKILVGAIGNEGMFPMHISHVFESEEDTLRTIAQFFDAGPFGALLGLANEAGAEIWSEEGQDFWASAVILDENGEALGRVPAFYSPNELSEVVTEQWTFNGENVSLTLSAASTETNPNGKASMDMRFLTDNPNYHALIEIAAPEGTELHLWNRGAGTGGYFADTLKGGVPAPNGEKYTPGDYESSMREFGGTGKAVITVGAWTIRDEVTNQDGQTVPARMPGEVGEIAAFSSRGPTADGRVKPDLTAPGNTIISAYSSYENPLFLLANSAYIVEEINYDGRTYPLGAYEGTSMACPVVAGVVALMLEANPELDPETARRILRQTATTDEFTGQLPEEGDNTWGAGKVDAFAAVDEAGRLVGVSELAFAAKSNGWALYPNPARERANLIQPVGEPMSADVRVELVDLRGAVAAEWHGLAENALDLSEVAAGAYVLRVFPEGQTPVAMKLLIVK